MDGHIYGLTYIRTNIYREGHIFVRTYEECNVHTHGQVYMTRQSLLQYGHNIDSNINQFTLAATPDYLVNILHITGRQSSSEVKYFFCLPITIYIDGPGTLYCYGEL